MQRILLFSHSGFSDENANGITMKNLLSAWAPEEKAEFYCDVQVPDYTAAHNYFRVTDVQMIKAFFGKKAQHIFQYDQTRSDPQNTKSGKPVKRIPGWLKKNKYNFWLKWTREILWQISPWGHSVLKKWIEEVNPQAVVYMVGESPFMDKLVLRTCERLQVPLILYNAEAYRIIDLRKRHGLERAYYRRTKKLYRKLKDLASLVIYNCPMLQESYEAEYPAKAKSIVAYNSAQCDQPLYTPGEKVRITYFGNLGVGRSDTLLEVAQLLMQIDPSLVLDIYGNATEEFAQKFHSTANICYHGFVDAVKLHDVVGQSDILLHVESFDEKIMPKLKYAFSTKLAQCLCAGRCFISYAPQETASTQYLIGSGGAAVASDPAALEKLLRQLIKEPQLRQQYAQKALETGMRNHNMQVTSRMIREHIGGKE